MKKFQKKETKKNNKGFTLLETMIAIFVISVGLVGVAAIIFQIFASASISSNNLIASYLTQEGIEIVRSVRDGNWLEERTSANLWNEGLTVCGATGFIVDYNHSYGPNQIDPVFPCYNNQFLNIDANGFYSYASGSLTRFQRRITISEGPIIGQSINVRVEIFWSERGRNHRFESQANLYNWR